MFGPLRPDVDLHLLVFRPLGLDTDFPFGASRARYSLEYLDMYTYIYLYSFINMILDIIFCRIGIVYCYSKLFSSFGTKESLGLASG